jgi:hypothetical protein
MTDGPGYGSQAVLDSLLLNGPPNGSPSNSHGATFGIGDRIVAITGEINNEPIFGGRGAGGAMPPAANRDLQIIVTCVFQGESDVVRVFHESNDFGMPLGVGRPPSYRFFIGWIGGSHNVALEGLPQAGDVKHNSGQREFEDEWVVGILENGSAQRYCIYIR